MKQYRIEYTRAAVKALQKLDRPMAGMIYAWIEKNLVDCTDPRAHGRGLTADRSGTWRYRVGDYRLIAQIQDEKVTILMLSIGHRNEVYLKH